MIFEKFSEWLNLLSFSVKNTFVYISDSFYFEPTAFSREKLGSRILSIEYDST